MAAKRPYWSDAVDDRQDVGVLCETRVHEPAEQKPRVHKLEEHQLNRTLEVSALESWATF